MSSAPERIPYDHDNDPEDPAPLRLDGAFWAGVGLITVFAAGVVQISTLIVRGLELLEAML